MYNLRKLKDEDIILFKNWVMKPYILKWYKNPDNWINEMNKRNNEFSFVHHYILMDENKEIGFCQYYDYLKGNEDWHGSFNKEDCCSIDYLIGEEEYLNKGISKIMIALLEEIIIKETDYKWIIVKPEIENIISRKALINADYSYDEINDIFFKKID